MADLPPDGFVDGHNPDVPPDGFQDSKSLSGFLSNAWQDVKNAGSGIKSLATAAVNYPKNLIISGAETLAGLPAADTPVGQGAQAIGNAALGAVPHTEDGNLVPGGIIDRIAELTPGVGHPLDAMYAHPVNTALDYSIIGGAAENAIGKAGELAGKIGEASEAAEAAGKAAETSGAVADAAQKIGDVSDKVGIGSKALAATSGASKSAFSQLWDDPHLLETAPKPEVAVDMVHQAANVDLPKLVNDPVAQISSDLNNGVNSLKSQYGATLDAATKNINDSLQAVKDNVSAQYDDTLNKMGLGQSLEDWQKSVTANGLDKPNIQSLLKDYNLAKSMNDAEPTKLAALYNTRQGLDDLVDYASQEKSGMTSKVVQKIEQTRAQVNDSMMALPQSAPIKALDDQWSSVMQNRRQLFQKFNNPDTAAKTLDALANGDREQSRVLGPALTNLEQMSGKPIVQPFLQSAQPLRDSISALAPHLNSPEATAKLVMKTATGEVPTLQAQALQHVDAAAGTNIVADSQKISPLVNLQRELGTKFADPGSTENTLHKIFANPDQNKDLINSLQHLEQITGKPIAQTVNKAMAASEFNEPFNASKGSMMLRVAAPVITASAGHLAPAVAMGAAISPKLIAKFVSAGASIEEATDAAAHVSHLGSVASDVAKAGSLASRDQLLKSLKQKE